jgi:L-asparaginase
LPTVVVLATGGTIAGAAASDVQAAYASGQVGVQQLLAAVPQAAKLAVLRGEQISNIGSQDMNDEVWLKLARRVNELTAMSDVDGVVITHGTDTIEETAYFLNLVVKSRKPVVLTAAMRPSTALSADGPLNFFNAVAVAANKQAAGHGVLVVVNDWIHGASSLTETGDGRATFLSPVWGLIGTVAYGSRGHRMPVGKHTSTSEFARRRHDPGVDIVMAYENMDGALIDAAVRRQGSRHRRRRRQPHAGRRERLAAQSKKGIVCVRSSRVTTGNVGRNVELDDDKLVVASLDKNPQKARVAAAGAAQTAASRTSSASSTVLIQRPGLAGALNRVPTDRGVPTRIAGALLFLSLLLGNIIRRYHFKGVGFGSVVGTLIAGIVISIFAHRTSSLRWAFFCLFLSRSARSVRSSLAV